MKKFFAAVACMFVVAASVSAASLRDAVCVVKAELSEKTTAFLTTYRDSLKKQGYGKYAEGIDGYLEGTFGSGFVYTASNGKTYVVTNRHVVDSAESVTVEFEKEDGTFDSYKGLKVLAVDDDLDVAVIELGSAVKKTGLPVKTVTVDDGEDVWTAGFPGLAGKPAWQFGKGTVTNSIARIDELVPSEVSTLIQHSAQVDSGNSGGPLLVKDAKSAYGYSVVGINTWKAVNRESTNFAIPMKAVKVFVEDAIAKKNTNATIEGRLTKFKAALEKDEQTFGGMSTYISNEMVSSLSSDTFIKVINTLSRDNQEYVIEDFVVDPLDGIRCALSAYIYNCFRQKKVLLAYTVGEPAAVEGESAYTIAFTVNEKTVIESKWISEQGMWKLVDFNGLVSNGGADVKSSGITFYTPYAMGIIGGVTVPPSVGEMDFTVGFDMLVSDYLCYYITFSKDHFGLMQKTAISADAKLSVPVNFGKVILTPYGFAGWSVFFGNGFDFDFNIGFNYGGGMEVAYDTGFVAPFVAAQFTGKAYKPDAFENVWNGRNAVDVMVGVRIFRAADFKLW